MHGRLPSYRWIVVALTMQAALTFPLPTIAQPGYQYRVAYEPGPPDVSPPSGRVAELVAELSNTEPARRDAARQALGAMGARIAPELRWLLERSRKAIPSTELQNGTIVGLHYEIPELTVLIDHAENERRSTPSKVTLRMTDASILDILGRIGAQVDAAVSLTSRPDASFGPWLLNARKSIDLDRASYWDMLRAVRRDLGLEASFASAVFVRPMDSVVRGPLYSSEAFATGPIWISPAPVTRQPSGGIVIPLDIAAEPRVRAGNNVFVAIDRYADSEGQSLLSRVPVPETYFMYDPTRMRPFTVQLSLPAPLPGRRIGTLQGRVGVSVGPAALDVAVIDLTRSGRQSFNWDGIVLSVQSVTRVGASYVVAGQFSMPAYSPLTVAIREVDSTGMRGELARIQLAERLGLLDATRTGIYREVRLGAVRYDNNRTVIEWTLTTKERPARLAPSSFACIDCVPTTLTWSTPTQTRWFIVPFALHNLDVPRMQ
jgi:hypothetical protein